MLLLFFASYGRGTNPFASRLSALWGVQFDLVDLVDTTGGVVLLGKQINRTKLHLSSI